MEIQEIKKPEAVDKINEILSLMKGSFVGKDTIIDLMGLCLIARENLFLLGPPGTAKSALVRQLSKLIKGKSFEYLLTRFTEPNELFGPFDIRKLREGELLTNTEGMLPEANLVFLDELLNANSAILNSLLMVLNEKIFRRGKETKKLPVLMIVGASNHLPEEEALQALFDRFLIRVRCDNVEPELLADVLKAGWKLEQQNGQELEGISTEEVQDLQKMLHTIDLSGIQDIYIDLIRKLRNAGVLVSDRRAVKLQRLIAASAIICKRSKAIISDVWILRYIWDTEEQREVISSIVNSVVETDENKENAQHPAASLRALPDADEIYKEAIRLKEEWLNPETTAAEKAIVKDRLRYLNGRCAWIGNEESKRYVQKNIDEFWELIIKD